MTLCKLDIWHLMNNNKVIQMFFLFHNINSGPQGKKCLIWPFRVPAGSDEQTNKTAALSLAS